MSLLLYLSHIQMLANEIADLHLKSTSTAYVHPPVVVVFEKLSEQMEPLYLIPTGHHL